MERCDKCDNRALDTSSSSNVTKCFHYITTIHLGVVVSDHALLRPKNLPQCTKVDCRNRVRHGVSPAGDW
jgi:hypothetical protein